MIHKQRLHQAGYFRELLATNPDIDESLRLLLRQCQEMVGIPPKMASFRLHRLLALRHLPTNFAKPLLLCLVFGAQQDLVPRVLMDWEMYMYAKALF